MSLRRILFAVALLSFILTGCTIGSEEMGKETEVIPSEFPPSMTGTIKSGGKTYEMEAGSYSWERKTDTGIETVLTDAEAPPQIAENFPAIKLEPHTDISIEVEKDPTLELYLWEGDTRRKVILEANNQFEAPKNIGRYIYEVVAKWQNGKVSYTFVVEVNK